MKKRVCFVILLIGILFPFAAITRFSSRYATAFNAIFDFQLAHILMHALLFSALSWMVMSLIKKLPTKHIFGICLGSVILVALAQEGIQMISVNTYAIGPAILDLGVDLAAGIIPPSIYYLINKSRIVER